MSSRRRARAPFLPGKSLCAMSDGLSESARSKWQIKIKQAKRYSYARRIRIIAEKARLRPGLLVLDVGCGIGSKLAEMAWFGAHCIGIEVERQYLKSVLHLKREFCLSLIGIRASGDTLPFRGSWFDVVMSNQFFERTRDLDLALQEQIRVLRKGGRLIITQANLLSPLTLVNLLILYPGRSKGRYGGLRWLFTKGKTKQNVYGTGYEGRDEDVHSRWWWRKKIRQCPDLHVEEVSSIAESATRWGKLIGRLFGDVLVVCTKVTGEVPIDGTAESV